MVEKFGRNIFTENISKNGKEATKPLNIIHENQIVQLSKEDIKNKEKKEHNQENVRNFL